MRELNIRWLGKLPYNEAIDLQKGLHSSISSEKSNYDYLLLLEHNNVITIGRSGDKNNLLVTEDTLNENSNVVNQVIADLNSIDIIDK